MSRSVRKYQGLSHTQSDTKQGKAWKKIKRRRARARAKVSEDGIQEAKVCAKGNYYNSFTEEDFEYIAGKHSDGYSPSRVKHRLQGK